MNKITLIYALGLFAFLVSMSSCRNENETNNQPENSFVDEAKDIEVIPQEELFDSLGIKFTAFKTEQRVGVSGTFSDLKVETHHKGATVAEVMEGANFTIDGRSISTGDTLRDGNLRTYFFEKLKNPYIKGRYFNFNDEGFDLEIEMDEMKKVYHISVPANTNELRFDFTIDILEDFEASGPLSILKEALRPWHQGYTWPDVELEGYIKLKS